MGFTKYAHTVRAQLPFAPGYQNFHDPSPPAIAILSVYQSYKKKKDKNCNTGGMRALKNKKTRGNFKEISLHFIARPLKKRNVTVAL
jgi:hypothetical protein